MKKIYKHIERDTNTERINILFIKIQYTDLYKPISIYIK